MLSVLLYVAYFFVADNISGFKIFKTAFSVISSPLFYSMLLLVFGVTLIFDLLYITLAREIQTPIYLMFRSVEENVSAKGPKQLAYARIVFRVKKLIFGNLS